MIDYSIFLMDLRGHWGLLLGVGSRRGAGGCSLAAAAGFPPGDSSCCMAWARGVQTPAAAVQGLSSPLACGIFLDQGSNPCPLHR